MSDKRSTKRYFWRGTSIDTIPTVHDRLNVAVAQMKMSDLKLLDQTTLTKETLVNAVSLWLHDLTATRGGISWLENELRRPMAELNRLVAEDRKERGMG